VDSSLCHGPTQRCLLCFPDFIKQLTGGSTEIVLHVMYQKSRMPGEFAIDLLQRIPPLLNQLSTPTINFRPKTLQPIANVTKTTIIITARAATVGKLPLIHN